METSKTWQAEVRARMPSIDFAETEEERALYLHRLNDTLARMPEPRRNIFLLSRVEHQSYEEIAVAYGISAEHVRREVRRAIFELRRRTRPQDFSLWERIKPMWMY